ncbi:hypothetical protein WG908_10930 [Sphingobium sp. AN641]|uniref:hypothetical protein n=1 Tax=Sphingobium sp. AN641 TaxID=3133443 RepID=UPI0030C39A40
MKSSILLHRVAALCLISAAHSAVNGASAQSAPRSSAATADAGSGLSYADLADLADGAALVAQARVIRVTPLPPEQAGGVTPGYRRLYVEAQVIGLIRGDGGISPAVAYLYDAPVDSRGKLPRLKKAQVILFARPGARPGQIQLVARDAQIAATPATLATVKSVLADLVANGAPPRITGVGDAFHVAGTVAGESETQIFLRTQQGDPVSLSILRRPGEPPRWAVALGEIVDEAAKVPMRGGLLWYRLTCSLPQELPARSVRTLSVQEAEAARADYRFVIQSLGPCDRTRAAG